jgi:organic radical activating enzyme
MKKDDINWIKDKNGELTSDPVNVENVRKLLNHKGCGFCLAKFTQLTLHLGTGKVHSCHHPSPHKIPVEEVQADYRALFNTSHLKSVRKEMLNDQKPEECDYCWRVEADGNLSDRSFKSSKTWALDLYDDVVNYTGDEMLQPKYLEVDFSNACNMSCLYCGPEFSSKWVEDLKQNGPIKVLENSRAERWVQGWQDLDNLNIPNREHNPYVEAFWKWFPEVYPNLETYRITGGEPLMSKETFRSMDLLAEQPNPNLDFSINTNLSVPDKLWNQFIERLIKIKDGKVKGVTVFTSVEGWGKRAEYVRRGLDFEVFKQRYEQLAQLGNVKVVIMAAYNLLSITSFKDLLEWQLEMKQKYNYNSAVLWWEENTPFRFREGPTNRELKERSSSHILPLGLDIPYLRHPKFLDAQICSDSMVQEYMIPTMNFMAQNTVDNTWSMHRSFEINEMLKLKNITDHKMSVTYSVHPGTEDYFRKITHPRAEFFDFIMAKDRRDGTDFLETFPEMEEFFRECEEAKQEVLKRTSNAGASS